MKQVFKNFIGIVAILLVVFTLTGPSLADESSKIDLNEATVQELVKIKGIGQKYAERIVEYRENIGKFEKIEDIMNIKGIGKKKFESIKDTIFIEAEETEEDYAETE
ncbi:ComEA family DNA-binding protein [Thermodesulfobacteriota bacterium]